MTGTQVDGVTGIEAMLHRAISRELLIHRGVFGDRAGSALQRETDPGTDVATADAAALHRCAVSLAVLVRGARVAKAAFNWVHACVVAGRGSHPS